MQEAAPDAGHVELKSKKLLMLRIDRHLTQQYVADALGIDASTLCRWEQNEDKINVGKLRELADFYHVSVEWLLSPEPLVLHMHDYKVENGANGAHNTVNVVPKEVLEEILQKATAPYSAHIESLNKVTERLLDLTERMFDQRDGRKG